MKDYFLSIILFAERHDRAIIALILVMVMFAGTVYSIHLGDRLRFADEIEYNLLANNLVKEHQFRLGWDEPTACRAPGLPFAMAPMVWFGAGIVHLRILNFLFFAISIFLTYRIVKRQSSRFSGVLAAVIVLCYPVLFYTAGTFYPETLASTLFLMVVYLLLGSEISAWRFLVTGLIAGFLVLASPLFAPILVILAIWYWISKKPRKLIGPLLFGLGIFLVVGAWTVRNYSVFDSFVFISTRSGYTLRIGNNADTTPSSCANDIAYMQEATELAKTMSEPQIDKYFKAKAVEYILDNKAQSAKMYFLKFLNYFNYRNELSTKSESSTLRDLIMLFTYGPLLLLLIIRLILSKRYNLLSMEKLFVLLYVSHAMLTAVFLTRIRYRVSFDFLIIIIVAIFINSVLRDWLQRNSHRLNTAQ